MKSENCNNWSSLMILNKFIRLISRIYKTLCYKSQSLFKIRSPHITRCVIFLALAINLALLESILHVLQHRLLHKTQVNSLRTKETLVDAPHKAMEKA